MVDGVEGGGVGGWRGSEGRATGEKPLMPALTTLHQTLRAWDTNLNSVALALTLAFCG